MKFSPRRFAGRFLLAACGLLHFSAQGVIRNAEDEGEAPAGGDVPVKNWTRLLEETQTAPITFPPTSTTMAEADALSQKWFDDALLKPALAYYATKPEEAEVSAFWTKMTHIWSGQDNTEPDAAMKAQLQKLAADPDLPPGLCLIAAGMLTYSLKFELEVLPLLERVADAPAETPLPRFFRVAAQLRVVALEEKHPKHGQLQAAGDKLLRIVQEALAQPLSPEETRQVEIAYFQEAVIAAYKGREQKFLEIFAKSALPEWLRLGLAGVVHCRWGMDTRLSSQRNLDHQYDKAKVQEEFRAARELLPRAWKLNQHSAYVAHEMMYLIQSERYCAMTSMGQEQPSNTDELRLWFDRAVAVRCDLPQAYSMLMVGYTPEAEGRTARLLAFGRACAETRRYDTRIPGYFSEAVSRMAGVMPDWRPLYRQPAIAKLLLETHRQRLAKLAGESMENTQRGLSAFDAWACGNYAAAAETYGKMPRDGSRVLSADAAKLLASRLEVDLEYVVADSLNRGGAESKAFAAADRLLASGDPAQAAEAEKVFRDLLPKADPAARPLLQANARLAAFRQAYGKGEWAPLPLEDRLCWRQLLGKIEWRPEEKRLRLITDKDFSKTLFRGRLGAQFELRGHFYNCNGPGRLASGLGIISGHTPSGAGTFSVLDWSTVRIDSYGRTNLVHYGQNFRGQRDEDCQRLPWKADNQFLYHYDNGHVTFSIDGTEYLHEAEVGSDASSVGSGTFGFAQLGQSAGSVTELWQLEARQWKPAQPKP